MNTVFFILFKIAVVLFVIGLILPTYALFWTTLQTRQRVVMFYGPIVLLLLIASLLTWPGKVADTPVATNPSMNIVTADSLIPETEKIFINTINQYADLYKKTGNPLDKTKIWRERDTKLGFSSNTSLKVTDWIGRVKQAGLTNDGNAFLILTISNNIVFKTADNDFADAQDQTLVSKDAKFHQFVAQLTPMSIVRFSAIVLRNASSSENEGMVAPVFLVKFIDVSPIQ